VAESGARDWVLENKSNARYFKRKVFPSQNPVTTSSSGKKREISLSKPSLRKGEELRIVGLLRSSHSERWVFPLYETGALNLILRFSEVLLKEDVILL